MDKVTRQCPQTTTFLKREVSRSGIEPRSLRWHGGFCYRYVPCAIDCHDNARSALGVNCKVRRTQILSVVIIIIGGFVQRDPATAKEELVVFSRPVLALM